MIVIGAIAAILLGLAVVFVLLTRLRLTVAAGSDGILFSITVAGCGIVYDSQTQRVGVRCGPWQAFLHGRARTSVSDLPAEAASPKPSGGHGRALPAGVRVRILKALLLFAARLISRLRWETARLETRPVIADPALAGVAYGMAAAFSGIFPGTARHVQFQPGFVPGRSRWSGKLAMSIRNRQIIYLLFKLWRDMPIWVMLRSKLFRKGVK